MSQDAIGPEKMRDSLFSKKSGETEDLKKEKRNYEKSESFSYQ